jgi:hypothetical protein
MVPIRQEIGVGHRAASLGHRSAGQCLGQNSARQGVEEVEQTRSDGEGGGGVPMIQDVEGRVIAVRCGTVSHGSLRV